MADMGNYVKDTTFEGWLGQNATTNQTDSASTIPDDFYTNYRAVTTKLGKNAKQPKDGIDSETYEIMNRIKLPDYHSAMTTAEDQEYWNLYNRDPEAAANKYDNDELAFYQDNNNYKLRAAQYLKTQPKEVREGILNNFDVSMTHAKRTLDDLIAKDDQRIEKEKYDEFLGKLSDGDKLKYIIRGLTGDKENVTNELHSAFEHYKERDEDDPSTVYKITTNTADNGVVTSNIYSTSGTPDRIGDATLGDAIKFGIDTIKNKWANRNTGTEAETTTETPAAEDTTDVVEYTYQPGDTFGQVIKNLGLESGNGLWGSNGDVEYYTQQLMDQGIWPDGTRGNIPIGTTIKLKRRPMTQEMIDYRNQYGYN